MRYYLSLGSNTGDREKHIDDACRLIEERCGRIESRSSNYYSEPWGYESANKYLNICIRTESDLQPMEMLEATQQIERELGRVVKGVYADRTIDIDLILVYKDDGEIVRCKSERLTLPHPLMEKREFVTIPLREIMTN
ncbi:MAG: 2-amino-4-hydroxy-6-hydroxymethyldihydropteridine diphosphokinase [Paludibacteraceae bacterium]|nr:2-amino-4-hydroxy-6-hydroxymethyldihydropteridine diphosphokinase [Paludibacteraceae bacterium]